MQKILIIDDDELFRETIVSALRQEGYETFDAEDGSVGLELARRQLPDLIICDIMMDNMDGYTTLATLREDPVMATIPFILMTGKADRPGMRRGMELGADDYLAKPFSVPELLAALKSRLEKREAFFQHAEKKLADLRARISMSLPHELRTPLSGILGFAELIRTENATLQPSQIAEMAEYINESATRLNHLIENFLIYAQIELLAADEPKVQLLRQNETQNVSKLMNIVARQKARHVGRSDDLMLELSDATVLISKKYLTKIVDELLDNAFKFSNPGTAVQVISSSSSEGFSLSISDRGRGMTSAQIADVGAYMQFERKVYEQQGSGLGLTIAKRLAELHGGTLTILSERGKGTTVVVKMPAAT
ncbi:MAG: response regulator [Bacteroidota bacterium]